jgi:hypothetical protein
MRRAPEAISSPFHDLNSVRLLYSPSLRLCPPSLRRSRFQAFLLVLTCFRAVLRPFQQPANRELKVAKSAGLCMGVTVLNGVSACGRPRAYADTILLSDGEIT